MIQVQNLTKRFGSTTAVDNISFEVKPGEIVGFLGPNGAGKTTTMRMLSCFMPATSGTVRIGGIDVLEDSVAVRSRIGYLPENVPLYKDMRVAEYLRYRARLKGLHGRRLRTRLDEVVFRCGLGDERQKVIGHLSKGFRQRVGLADALVHEPDLLILDEPTIGLDPNQIMHIRSLIKGLAQRHTVLLSSHILHEVEMICQRVLIIKKGRIVASDTPGKLVGLLKGNPHIVIEVQGDRGQITRRLEGLKGVLGVVCRPLDGWHHFTCECEEDTDLRAEMFKIISELKLEMRQLDLVRKNLEDVFVEITNK